MKLKTKFCKIALPAALVGTLLLSGCQPNSGGTELKEIAPALKLSLIHISEPTRPY